MASVISFYLGQALLSSHHLGVAITSPGALRSVIGAALYVTVAGMIGVALGALLRNTAAGISTFAAVFFVIPPLTGLLPASISKHLAQYLPSNAGEALWGGHTGCRTRVPVDGVRGAVRVRRDPHRRGRVAAEARRRLMSTNP